MQIKLNETKVELLAAPGIWFPESKSLLLADTHLGKSASMRVRGIAVPEGELHEDLERIDSLIKQWSPKRLVIAGDFLHSRHSPIEGCLDQIQSWAEALPCRLGVALGNHDRMARLDSANIEYHKRIELDGFEVVHEPERANPKVFSLCGHLHPVVKIRDGRRTSFRLPCFWLSKRKKRLVLPSFGSLTGGSEIDLEEGDSVFCSIQGTVSEIPNELLRQPR